MSSLCRNTHDAVLNIADFYCLAFYVFMFLLLPFFLSIRVACMFSTYSTFSQEVSRFFSLDFVKQRSLAGELVSSCSWILRLTDQRNAVPFECRHFLLFLGCYMKTTSLAAIASVFCFCFFFSIIVCCLLSVYPNGCWSPAIRNSFYIIVSCER